MTDISITLSEHIRREQREVAVASGEFSGLLGTIALGCKIIAREVNKAGLAEILGLTGKSNVQGEEVQKLDEFANETLVKNLEASGHVGIMGSEENDDVIKIKPPHREGKYVVLFDPLDGSGNIDANVSIGTIFSVYHRLDIHEPCSAADCLQPGTRQVAAGYVVYGSSTIFVYTSGQGVNGFTLDPTIGEFLLSHRNIKTPKRGKIYSVNEGNHMRWSPEVQRYVDYLKTADKDSGRPYSSRYIGSLVADFHRNLVYGGVFLYPRNIDDERRPNGKLRLLYEVNPLAFVAEQAGGAASNGTRRVLEVEPTDLHQRTPVILGSADDVAQGERFFRGEEG